MHNLDNMIIDLSIIMVVGSATLLIFKKLNLPIILAYILAGFLISPNFAYLPSIMSAQDVHSWANLGIVFLMFALGLDFSFKKIAEVGISAIVTAMTVMSGMIAIGFLVGTAMGWSRMDSIFLGGMLSMSSTMIIMKSFEEKGLQKEKFSRIVMGTLVIEDIGGIFMMIILSAISASKNFSGVGLLSHMGLLTLLLIIWFGLGIYIIPTFLRKIHRLLTDEVLLIVSIGICMGMVVISNKIGFSEALGAFMAGSIIGGTAIGERIEKVIMPIKDMFGAIFFVSVGMLLVPELLIKYIGPIILISVITIIGQMFLSTLGMTLSGQSLHTSVRGGFSLVQIGEFSFIVATLGLSLGVTGKFLYPVIVCVSIITTITTPFFIGKGEAVYGFLNRRLPDSLLSFLDRYTSNNTNDDREKDSVWKTYIFKYMGKVILTTALLFGVYYGGLKIVIPLFRELLPGKSAVILATVITCGLMIPVIGVKLDVRWNEFKYLWLKSRYNRLPLALLYGLKQMIALFFIVLTCRNFLGLPYIPLMILGILVVVLISRSEFFKSQSIKVEARFVANFNEKILQKRQERGNIWLENKLFVVEFGLSNPGMCTNVRLLLEERILDVLVIKILRNGEHINMPGAEEAICQGDQVTVIGSKGQLDTYLIALEKAEHIKTPTEEMITLRQYMYQQDKEKIEPENQIMCCAIKVAKGSTLVKKTIKNSGFKESYGGFIVGIERGHYPIVAPNSSTIIEDKDILWAVGKQDMADRLLEDGLIQV